MVKTVPKIISVPSGIAIAIIGLGIAYIGITAALGKVTTNTISK